VNWLDFAAGTLTGALLLIVLALWCNRRPKGQAIQLVIIKEWTMLTKGVAANFLVKAFNAAGAEVPVPADLAVTATNGTVSPLVGGAGSVVPATGDPETLTATSASLGLSATVSDTVQDITPVSLTIAFVP